MPKWAKILIPFVQAGVAVAVFVAEKQWSGTRFYEYYLRQLSQLVVYLNFPLVVVWTVAFAGLKLLTGYTPPNGGVFQSPSLVLIAVLLTSSVGLFWYLILVDIERRRRGKSVFSCSGPLKQMLVVAVFVCFGIGEIVYAYIIARPLWYARTADALLMALFPALCGILFVVLGIYDSIAWRRRVRSANHQRPA